MVKSDYKKAVQSIRRTFARKSDIESASTDLKNVKDSNIQALLKEYDGNAASLIEDISKIKGPTTDDVVSSLLDRAKSSPAPRGKGKGKAEEKKGKGKGKAEEKKGKGKEKPAPKAKAPEKPAKEISKPKSPEPVVTKLGKNSPYVMELIDPIDLTCPDKNQKGDPVSVIQTKEGFYTCGAIVPKSRASAKADADAEDDSDLIDLEE